MKQQKNIYKTFQSTCEKENNKYWLIMYKKFEPKIKELALSVGVDMFSSQHSCYVDGDSHPDYVDNNREMNDYTREIDKKFQPFINMLYSLSDNLNMAYYFEIKNGKFRWL